MAKQKQEIKVTLHIVEDDDRDRSKNSEEFWISKIEEKIQLYINTDVDRRILIENLREYK